MRCWCGGDTDGLEKCSESKFHDPNDDGRPKIVDRLYVAGPMSGYPECNYPAFHHAADRLRDRGFYVVNPAEFGNTGSSYTALLRKDLRRMLECDGIALLENWWESNGARNEVQVAGLLRMPCRSVDEWVARGRFTEALEEKEPVHGH